MNTFCSWFTRPLGRTAYFLLGFFLMVAKISLDHLIGYLCFGRDWHVWNYVVPGSYDSITAVPHADRVMAAVLLLSSLPFLLAGLYLTLRRLKSAGLSLWMSVLFFVPVVNIIFFITLSLIPERQTMFSHPGASALPMESLASASVSFLTVVPAGILLVLIGVKELHNYGWGLFVGLPFALGLVAVLIYARDHRRGFWGCIGVAVLPLVFIGIGLFAIAFEGAICIAMAAPIAVILAFAGGCTGYSIQTARHDRLLLRLASILVLGFMPFLMGMESASHPSPPLLHVTTSLIIDAPPDRVWPHVISFPDIPDPRDWLFKTGIAYPTHAVIIGSGVGAIRHCIFSTGEFVEPVQIWDEPRLLKFSVASQPDPLTEMSPYPHIHPPHLHGYMISHEGELRLTPLAGGRTLLQGTTWYTNRIWPIAYWQVWSDFIIHRIHLRVMNHIKELSETKLG